METKLRDILSENIVRALEAYDKDDMQGFLKEITAPFSEKNERLFSYEKSVDTIVPQDLINSLLKHGIRPDGAAYILNTIGEVLISGKIKVVQKGVEDHEAEAKKIFTALQEDKNNKLMEKAKELDNLLRGKKIKNFRNSQISDRMKKIRKLLTSFVNSTEEFQQELDEKSIIAQNDVEESMEISFESRIEEMQYVARLNLLLVKITQKGWDKAELLDLKKKIFEKDKVRLVSKERIKAIEDFLWAMNGENINEDDGLLKPQFRATFSQVDETSMAPNEFSTEYVNNLINELNQTNWPEKKENIQFKLACYYEKMAKQMELIDKINSFTFCKKALTAYKEVMRINPKNKIAFLGSVKCLLNMAKFKQVISLLKKVKDPGLWFDANFWMLGSIAYRKLNNYEKAMQFILEAKKLEKSDKDIQKEIDLIRRIQENNMEKKLLISKELKPVSDEIFYKRRSKAKFCKILSIDGGGIRGIIPAFWLMEIERRIKKPISHLFHILAGTSTGAIITAGLSCPLNSYTPKYTASDIIEIYRNGKEIFSKNKIPLPLRCKYNEKGRLNAFTRHFGDFRLKDCLNDIVVPAVKENDLTKTFCFSSMDARKDISSNFKLVDVLMATSAAPTFFPAHLIDGEGIFLDGGVHANNPALLAYQETRNQKIPNENIFMLSLGTGSYLPESLSESTSRGKLFWAENLVKVTLPQNEGNIDSQMYTQLGENYKRWQVWLENPITLDDYREEQINKLMEIAQEHIEELYSSEKNSLNELLEFLSEGIIN